MKGRNRNGLKLGTKMNVLNWRQLDLLFIYLQPFVVIVGINMHDCNF